MAAVPCISLQNGTAVPAVGLGTWRSAPDVVGQAVKDAIDVGYRHFDCAHIYGNEREVGMAIAEKIEQGVIKREEIFITSKLWNTYHRPELVRGACETTLKNLGTDYLDNYLIHWPMGLKEGDELQPKDDKGIVIPSDVDYVDTWPAMEALVDAGICRNIGLSNFNKRQIERVLAVARIAPANLQIECHPYLNQKRLLEFCRQRGIVVTAYSPLGSAHSPYTKPGEHKLTEHPQIVEIAKKHDKSAAQVLLRYQVQRGVVVIPRSVTKAHMEMNINICDFKLSPQDMAELDSLDFNGRIMTMEVAAGHPHHPFENDDF